MPAAALLATLQRPALRRAAWAGDLVLAAEQGEGPCHVALHVSLRRSRSGTDASALAGLLGDLGADPSPLHEVLGHLRGSRDATWRASGVAVSVDAAGSINRVNVYVVPLAWAHGGGIGRTEDPSAGAPTGGA